tara:strand:+ start:482 stop:706 length:225 start_codon:yes stop_codon:yes gene_type:complete
MNIQIASKPAHTYVNSFSTTSNTLLVDLVTVELMLEDMERHLECCGGAEIVRKAIKAYFRSDAPHPVIHLDEDE